MNRSCARQDSKNRVVVPTLSRFLPTSRLHLSEGNVACVRSGLPLHVLLPASLFVVVGFFSLQCPFDPRLFRELFAATRELFLVRRPLTFSSCLTLFEGTPFSLDFLLCCTICYPLPHHQRNDRCARVSGESRHRANRIHFW